MHAEKLSLIDLQVMFEEIRTDGPGRRSVSYESHEGLPRSQRGIESSGVVDGSPKKFWHAFEFEPNPPGCRGIRNPPKPVHQPFTFCDSTLKIDDL